MYKSLQVYICQIELISDIYAGEVIGNVKSFASAEELKSMSSYNGPEFEDVDEKLQESFDELLAEVQDSRIGAFEGPVEVITCHNIRDI